MVKHVARGHSLENAARLLGYAPELFRAVLASVPFLDVAGTLQDATLPLTANEWARMLMDALNGAFVAWQGDGKGQAVP